MTARILLIDPRSPYNVGGVLRACHVFGASTLAWTGTRVPSPESSSKRSRLPRDERLKEYNEVARYRIAARDEAEALERLVRGMVPVCVERSERAERLPHFVHPQKALYIFGPEDGSVPARVRALCHRFLTIPSATSTPLNLAASVNVVLAHRYAQREEALG